MEAVYSDTELDAVESDLMLKQLIRSLPKDLQEIVIIRYGQDMTIREVAKVVDLPLRTVQSRLRSALKQLKKEFEERGAR